METLIITDYGDSDVGIPDRQWLLTGEFDEEYLEDFKEALKDAFEVLCGERVGIITKTKFDEEEHNLWEFLKED